MSILILQPFATDTAPKGVSITANVSRNANMLAVQFSLADLQSSVMIQPCATAPARRDNLWQATCFEFFLSQKNSPAYWEFNLSPSGDWNIYHFNAYRQGLREEKAFSVLPFSVEQSANYLALSLSIDLSPIVASEKSVDLGITAVIQTKRGDISYWALNHCGDKPDFHLRESFLVSCGA